MTTLWGSESVKDIAESVGIPNLNKDTTTALCRDVEYRISQVLEEALKFMRHGKRTILWSQDISQALKVLDIEPLYGYETTRPLNFGEASIGPGQPLFYVEDEEMDFEKLINAPLPKVPREISFTAHWLAVEGVQPTIPQNPSTSDSRALDLLPKNPTNPGLSSLADTSSTTTRAQVKHILSKELQLYFEKVCSAILPSPSEPTQSEYRAAGLASLRDDPGLHQLVPYFVQFVAEKVTHSLRDLCTLTSCLALIDALSQNPKLNLAPYVAGLVPSILTCLLGRTLGLGLGTADHFDLRDLAASLLARLCARFGKSSPNLRPRLARSCLKSWLDPNKSAGTHYGAILGLSAIGGAEVVRSLVVPNLREFEALVRDDLDGGGSRQMEAEKVVAAILNALGSLVDDEVPNGMGMNGHSEASAQELREKLEEKVGEVVGSRIADAGHTRLAKAVLQC